MGVVLYFLSVCILLTNINEAARILAVFPVPSISHQVVFRPLTQELAKRGHDVTVITTDPIFPKGGAPANFTEIDVHDISYDIWIKTYMKESKGNEGDTTEQLRTVFKLFSELFDVQLQNEEVQGLLRDKNQKFDVLIIEGLFRPARALAHVFKAPIILMSSLGALFDNLDIIGAPTHPLLYPNPNRQRLNNLSWWGKITEVYNNYKLQSIFHNNLDRENEMLRKHFGPELPSVTEFNKNVDMLMLNVNPVFAGIQPVPPSVVFMDGLHQKPDNELPADLKSFLDSSKHGVIYLSFGTNVDPSLLPADKIQVLVNTFSQLPYDVLWKWNKDELPGRSKNIRIGKWFPQSDLLKHPKVKVFVTQGGLQSTDEAITAGVPLIGVPMLGDQWFNVERYEYHKIGIRMDLNIATEEIFKDALLKIINDDSYRQNVIRLRTLIWDQPQPPLERAIWSIEHLLRHGGARHLRSPAANISWAEYLELELVLTLLAGLLAIVTILVVIVCKLLNYWFRKPLPKTKRS